MALPPPSLQSTSHILSNLCSATPPLPLKSPPPPFLETIKPRLRWTSPISFLPSTCCPPPRLPLHPIPSVLPLSSPHPSLPATFPCPSSSQRPCFPSPSPSFCFCVYPTSSISRSILSAPTPAPLLLLLSVRLCMRQVLLTGLGRADNAGS